MIEVRDVRKWFRVSRRQRRELGASFTGNRIEAVAGVSFDCRPGRVFALLGPNGAGKTTTLRMIATLLRPSAGSIRVAGHDTVREAGDARRQLGFLTGSTKLYDRLTPDELVRYVADLHGIDRETFRRRRDELFARLGIDAWADRRIGRLSTGMKQKVSIARTIIHDPPVLVLDEATAGLDVVAARGIVELIREARERARTVLFSTHRMGEVAQLADDLAIIHRGRLVFCDTFEAFRAQVEAPSLEDAFIRTIERADAEVAA